MHDERAVHKRAQELAPAGGIGPSIGLTAKEAERASIGNYLRAVVAGDKAELHYFAEVSTAVEKAAGQMRRGPGTYLVPGEVTMRRDMTKAGVSGSQYLVGTGIEGFSSALDAASVLSRLPVTRLPNLVGDVTITRESVKGSATWLADEASVIGDAQSTFGQIALTPKLVSGVVTASRQLLTQSGPAGNAFIEKALATVVAEAVDKALVAGTGNSGQPLGLLNVSGIDTRAGTSFALSDAAAMLRVSEGYAGAESAAWLCGVAVAEDLRTRVKLATYGNGFLMADDGTMLGRPVVVSRSVGDQVLVVAPWSQVWFASWGALELGADPMTYFRDGRVQIRCLWSVDFAVERAGAVAVCTALT